MPNAFDITTASTTVQLDDATRKGQASYTVKNICGRPLRGEAKLLSDQAQLLEAGKEWIKIDPPIFRDFLTDGSELFTIQIAVPTQAPAGTYGFWMRVSGIENTDEMTDVGPNIDFTVKELPKPVPWWKKLPWWVWAIAGGVLLLIIILVVVLVFIPRTPATFNAPVAQDTTFTIPALPGSDFGSNPLLILFDNNSGTTVANIVGIQPDITLPHERVSIRSATLHLFVNTAIGSTNPNPLRISASRATSAWDESIGSATPSCDTSQVSTVAVVPGVTEIDIDITEIYKKLRTSGANNFGICLTSPETQYAVIIMSSEFATPAQRPFIFVDYRH